MSRRERSGQLDQSNPYEAPQVTTEPSVQSGGPYQKPTLAALLLSFDGRIPRRAYWGVTLTALGAFYAMVFAILFAFGEESPIVMGAISILYVPMVWISLAVQVKRWHDRDKSGWWIFIGVIPIVGPLWAFVEAGCLRGTLGPNRFGPDPT